MDKLDNKYTLGMLLARTLYAVRTSLNKHLLAEGIDLPHSQFVVLKNLYEEDGITQAELAKRVYKNTAAVKRTLDNLEIKGLVKRSPVAVNKNLILITEEGKELIPRIFELTEELREKLVTNVTAEEYDLFVDILNRVYKNTD